MVEIKSERFPSFCSSSKIGFLTQLSSCFVNRVFSRLSVIEDVCGGILEHILEMRLFLQCNGDLHELMSAIQKYIEGQ